MACVEGVSLLLRSSTAAGGIVAADGAVGERCVEALGTYAPGTRISVGAGGSGRDGVAPSEGRVSSTCGTTGDVGTVLGTGGTGTGSLAVPGACHDDWSISGVKALAVVGEPVSSAAAPILFATHSVSRSWPSQAGDAGALVVSIRAGTCSPSIAVGELGACSYRIVGDCSSAPGVGEAIVVGEPSICNSGEVGKCVSAGLSCPGCCCIRGEAGAAAVSGMLGVRACDVRGGLGGVGGGLALSVAIRGGEAGAGAMGAASAGGGTLSVTTGGTGGCSLCIDASKGS